MTGSGRRRSAGCVWYVRLWLMILVGWGGGSVFLFAQTPVAPGPPTVSYEGTEGLTAREVIARWQQQTGLVVLMLPGQRGLDRTAARVAPQTLESALRELLRDSRLSLIRAPGRYVVIAPRERAAELETASRTLNLGITRSARIDSATARRMLANVAGANFNLIVRVVDAESGQALEARVLLMPSAQPVPAQPDGSYRTLAQAALYELTVVAPGYLPQSTELLLARDERLEVELVRSAVELETVSIEADAARSDAIAPLTGLTRMTARELRAAPALFSEPDLVRSLLQVPGVSNVGEGAAGFNVRGGSVDQNLVLIDGAEVFNVSHLFGFFSAVNPDLLEEAELYKGSVPARFGGRAASVLDVSLRGGNRRRVAGLGSLGLISSRLLLEGPIVRNHAAWVVSARGALVDHLLGFVDDARVAAGSAHYYDANLRLDANLSQNHHLALSAYFGRDAFRFGPDSTNRWTNSFVSLSWRYFPSVASRIQVTASLSDYSASLTGSVAPRTFELTNGIRTGQVQGHYTRYFSDLHVAQAGAMIKGYAFRQGRVTPMQGSAVAAFAGPTEQAIESAVWLQDDFPLLDDRLIVSAGLRYSHYWMLGPSTVYTYASDQPRTEANRVGAESVGAGGVVAQYGGLEPRLGLSYRLSDQTTLKAAYTRSRQYLHLASASTSATPLDIWKSSDRSLRPQVADQVSVGLVRQLASGGYELSVEAYGRRTADLLDYRDFARLLLATDLGNQLLQGEGRAYGVELLMRKRTGRLTGSAAYAYARSLIRTGGAFVEDRVNAGREYPTLLDKPHQLNTQANLRLNRRWSVSANFQYSTGRPITAPDTRYTIGSIVVVGYGERNNARIPDYHRLDLSVTLGPKLKRSALTSGTWTFALYNVYGRANPFSVFFVANTELLPQAYRLAVIGTIVPSISYQINF